MNDYANILLQQDADLPPFSCSLLSRYSIFMQCRFWFRVARYVSLTSLGDIYSEFPAVAGKEKKLSYSIVLDYYYCISIIYNIWYNDYDSN